VLTGIGLSVSAQDHSGLGKCVSGGCSLWDSSSGIGVTLNGTQSGIGVNSMENPVLRISVCGVTVLSYSDAGLTT